MANNDQDTSEERTETATPFRREEFRRRGHVALSKEVLSVVLLGVVGASLFFISSIIFKEFGVLASHFLAFGPIEDFDKNTFIRESILVIRSLAWMCLPVMGVAFFFGIIACVSQIGLNFTTEPISPNFDRLNPINGIKRMFSLHGTMEAIKAIIKLSLAVVILWYFLKAEAPKVGQLFEKGTEEMVIVMLVTVSKLFFMILGALAVMAGLDYGFQKFQLEKQLKMTKKEAKEEFKLREGDPLMKQRIRTVQRRLATSRMMQNIPEADVIVTNPTHLAIALKYDADEMPSPKVIAKGAGHVAKKIRELAVSHRIPLVENKPLARSLFKKVDINHYVPKELYRAVASVLSYVYRLKGMIPNG